MLSGNGRKITDISTEGNGQCHLSFIKEYLLRMVVTRDMHQLLFVHAYHTNIRLFCSLYSLHCEHLGHLTLSSVILMLLLLVFCEEGLSYSQGWFHFHYVAPYLPASKCWDDRHLSFVMRCSNSYTWKVWLHENTSEKFHTWGYVRSHCQRQSVLRML